MGETMNQDPSQLERIIALEHVVTRIQSLLSNVALQDEPKKNPFGDGETPDFGPWIDNVNCRACVIAIRTTAKGAYQEATLKLLDGCTDIGPKWKKDAILVLRNPAWESEFKRAQSSCLRVCLRVTGEGKVLSIEVEGKDKRCCPEDR
jgi:hypothetical protein